MSNVAEGRSQSQSGVEQVKEQVQEVAGQAKGQTREQLRSQLSDRSSQAGEQVSSTAQAMRKSTEQLRQQGNSKAAELIEAVADRGERLGTYLSRADGDQILRDVEDFARRQPWLMVGGSAVAGFLASRFMKASSRTRYQGQAPQAHRRTDLGREDAAGYGLPPASPAAVGGGSVGLD